MVSGKIRSTRRLRSWIVEQVSSGKFNGLVWDNPEKTMFRIPWKHAGKQDFRSDEDAAIFKAWAEFKGKLSKPNESDPACWKTRLRCALNKSPEFREVTERSQLDISEPYKVYQLVPLSEQGVVQVKIEKGEKDVRRSKRRQRTETESSDEIHPKKMIKEEDTAAQQISMDMEASNAKEFTLHLEELTEPAVVPENGNMVNEIQLNVMIETVPQCEDKNVSPSFLVSVFYVGEEVLRRDVLGDDVRIAFVPPSPSPPSLSGCSFPRIPLPPPSADCSSAQAISDLLPFMEKGVVLTCSGRGVYAKRFCQGRVFWRGPQRTGQKLERTQPTMIFNKEQFRQELDLFRSGGCQPESEITLCFGEELSDEDNLAEKFIIIKISLPWANKEIQEADSFRNSLSILQSLAQQSSSGEVTLNLVSLPEQPVTS